MAHIRSTMAGVAVPISPEANSNSHITNNVVITREKPKSDQEVKEVSDGVYVVYPNKEEDQEQNPYRNLRDVNSANQRLDNISNIVDSNQLIQVLSLIIDIMFHNPLLVNNYIIAEEDTLKELIKILTSADSVDITVRDPSCECTSCCGKSRSIETIDSIYVHKNNTTCEFAYVYSEAKQILERNHISTRFIVSAL